MVARYVVLDYSHKRTTEQEVKQTTSTFRTLNHLASPECGVLGTYRDGTRFQLVITVGSDGRWLNLNGLTGRSGHSGTCDSLPWPSSERSLVDKSCKPRPLGAHPGALCCPVPPGVNPNLTTNSPDYAFTKGLRRTRGFLDITKAP